MSTGGICLSMVPGEPSSSSETKNEKLPNSWIRLKAILSQDKNYPIIPRVPHLLRQVNEKAYEPYIISIGPYHHGKPHLKEMEDIKKSFFIETVGENNEYLQKLINPEKAREAKLLDKSEKELEDLEAKSREMKKIKAIKDLETAIRDDLERIKACYAKPLEEKLKSDEEFVDMVLFDGFFIVQFFRKIFPSEIIQRLTIFSDIVYDLILLENQLPFFVLVKLHQTMTQNEETKDEFIGKNFGLFGEDQISECPIPKENIQHLQHLIHGNWIPSGQNQSQSNSEASSENEPAKDGLERKSKSRVIPCARELEEAGISFKSADEKVKCSLDIEFQKRKSELRIPKIIVDDNTMHKHCRKFG